MSTTDATLGKMLVAIVANTPSLLISQALPRGNVVSRRVSVRMDAVAASEDAVANPVEEQIKSLVTSNAIELSRFESAMCLESFPITSFGALIHALCVSA